MWRNLAGALALTLAVPTAAPAQDVALPAITVAPVVTTDLHDRVRVSGLIEPADRVDVQPRIEGQAIEAVLAEVGDRVREGQVLARLAEDTLVLQRSQLEASRASAEAGVAQAEASVTDARATSDEAERVATRTADLRARGAATQAALDQATAGATSARARLTAAEQGLTVARAQLRVLDAQIADVDLRLDRTKVTAPVAGLVIDRSARQGAIASAAGGALFVIARDGEMELMADVAEGDLGRLRPGQAVLVQPVGAVAALAGQVRLVEPAVDVQTRLGRVRIAIDDDASVRPGLFAEAEITLANATAPALPVTALSRDASGATVMRVGADGVVERVAVTTGIRDDGMIEIRSGLAVGDTVVARAGAFVRPGDRIRPIAADAAAASN